MKKIKLLLIPVAFLLLLGLFGKDLVALAQQALENLPNVNINTTEQYGSQRGGLISMSSTEEPAISLGSWNLTGDVTLKLYKADEQTLLEYLTHDDENKQTNPNVNVSDLQFIAEMKSSVNSGYQNRTRVNLPLDESGIWYLTLESGESKNTVFILRSKNGLIVQEAKEDLIVWGQKFSDLRKMTGGTVTAYNMEGSVQVLSQAELDADGLATLPTGNNTDLIVLRHEGDIAIAPINLQYINIGAGYQRFNYETDSQNFLFTDRPIYKPGNTVYYKAILRNDDDARYSIPSGLARVIIYKNWNKEEKIFEKLVPINAHGSVDGEFLLPENLSTGYYSVFVAKADEDINDWRSGISFQFQVEHYRKPEYSLETDAPGMELVRGDQATFLISGEYFSGQPVANQEVKYTLTQSDAYDSEYLQEALNSDTDRYYYSYGGQSILSGTATLDEKGRAVVSIDTQDLHVSDQRTKIITLMASFTDSSGNPVESSQSIVLYPGEFSLYRTDYQYSGVVDKEYELKLKLSTHGSFDTKNISVNAEVSRSWWEGNSSSTYKNNKEQLDGIQTKSDSNGEVTLSFNPKNPGSYTFTVTATDERGNKVTKEFSAWIRSTEYNYFLDYYYGSRDLSLSTDKQVYQPGDTAKIFLTSDFPFRDVLVSNQRSRVDRYQVVSLNGTDTTIELPVLDVDMPNTFVRVSSFVSHNLSTAATKLTVPANKKKITVSISPDKDLYGPGQSAVVNILTEDQQGNPVPAEVTVWSVDKAIFELAYDQTRDIFDTFWKERYNSAVQGHSLEGINVDGAEGGGGCFLEETQVLLADGTTKAIQNVAAGDKILTRKSELDDTQVVAKVTGAHKTEVEGYLIINETLRVTPDHLVYLNGRWQEIGNAVQGDTLVNESGHEVTVRSVEWIMGKTSVYNLEVGGYHTFFADGLWVHNQKGDTRTIFKDTAYWNPSIQTDSEGRAQVVIPLPDNLTTWVIAGIASNSETQVGQSTTEIKVSKDIVVRPVLPNVLRTQDRIDFSALVHNFTDQDQLFTASLDIGGASIEQSVYEKISILKNSFEEVVWDVQIGSEEMVSKIATKAQSSTGKIDEIIQEIPVIARGFYNKKTFIGHDPITYDLQLSNDSVVEKSDVTISLSSTKVGTLPSAMKYLIEYPYGCVEQTTSRFVPVLLANENKELFAEVTKGKDLDQMVEKGIIRLADLQQYDGGWGWWSFNQSDPFITAYVTEYLVKAREQGYDVPEILLEKSQAFLESKNNNQDLDSQVFKAYGLQQLGSNSQRVFTLAELENMSHDVLPYAVIVNFNNGIVNNDENGLNRLVSLAKTQGEGMYWEAGNIQRFRSIDTSTAMAVRALMLVDSSNEIVPKAIHYLSVNRKREYWSNTFGTVQVARAMLDYSKEKSELDADYSYSVKLDAKVIATGTVSGNSQLNKTITVPADEILSQGSKLTIEKDGTGQIYSTVVLNEFLTKSIAQSADQSISITREYVSERGYEYGIAIGDLVTVELTVEGLTAETPYLLVADELPAGLIPINTNLKNQDGTRNDNYSYSETKEYTQNGVIIAVARSRGGKQVFSYKARAIATGEFYAPPAKVELMYSPEVSSLTQEETVTITSDPERIRERRKDGSSFVSKLSKNRKDAPVIALVVVIVSLIILKKYNVEIKTYLLQLKEKIKNRVSK